MSTMPILSQRKGSDDDEERAYADLEKLAFKLFVQCDTWLQAGIPVIAPASALGKDDVLTAPFGVSTRAIYAAIAGWETTRAWTYRFRDHGLGVHVDYVMFRPIIENLLTAIWILGPDESNLRMQRALSSWESGISDAVRFGKKVRKLSASGDYPGAAQHIEANEKLYARLAGIAARTGVDVSKQGFTYTAVVTEAGEFIPDLGPLGTYWVWSVSSGMTHGQALIGINMSNFDTTDRGAGDLDAVFEASPRVVLHYVRSIEMMLETLSDLFHKRLAAIAKTPA